MGQAPSTTRKPEVQDQEVGPWQIAICFMVVITLWMSSMDLPPEAHGLYLIMSSTTIGSIVVLFSYRFYSAWAWRKEVEAWHAKQLAAAKSKAPNQGEVEFSRKIPHSLWDMANRAHPSAFLSSSMIEPRLFPFPVGLASAENKNMVWESGVQPQIGRFQQGEAFDKKKREAAAKGISERLKAEDKAKNERDEYYAEQKRVMEHRIWHIKIVSSILVLAFASKRLAMLALIPFMYSVFHHEMSTLLMGKKSTYKGTKRPRALGQNKPDTENEPGMALTYLYQASDSDKSGPAPIQWSQSLGSTSALLSSTDSRLAGDGIAPKTVPTHFKYAKASSSSSSGLGSSSGGGSGAGGMGDMASMMASMGM